MLSQGETDEVVRTLQRQGWTFFAYEESDVVLYRMLNNKAVYVKLETGR